MGRLREKQSVFLRNLAKLIQWADEQGFELTGGELYRPEILQRLYKKQGKSKVAYGQHQMRLAVDLNLFIDGKYRRDRAAYKPLAEYWKSLHPNNRAGYDWGWDANHFEMR